MNGNFWDDQEEESLSEYDLLEEAQETEELADQYAQQPTVIEAQEEELEQIEEESHFELDREESNIIYNARRAIPAKTRR